MLHVTLTNAKSSPFLSACEADNHERSRQLQESLQFKLKHVDDDYQDYSFMPWKFHPAHSDWEPELRGYIGMMISFSITSEPIAGSMHPEAYSITGTVEDWPGTGHPRKKIVIRILGHSSASDWYAFATLAQFLYRHSTGAAYLTGLPFTIEDFPRFSRRGLNLDIARNEIMPKDVIRTIRAMSFVKLNTLHLHVSDSQSWPLDIPRLPQLSAKGSYRKQGIWSAEMLKQVQRYGWYRGVQVYLEIDMPGHTASIHHSRPDLIAGYAAVPLENYTALEPPAGQLRLNSSAVLDFVNELMGDLLPRVSPFSKYFHLGGDELNSNVYALDPGVNSTDKETIRPLLQSFYDHVLKWVAEYSLTPIFWEETLLDWNLTLPANSIVQVWQSSGEALSSITSRGHKALFGSATHWYLDHGFGTFLDKSNHSNYGSQDRKVSYSSWRDVYAYDPLANVPSKYHDLVPGGEVHLWCELTDSTNLDFKLWPRVAAAAEVLWSGPSGQATEDTTRRLAEVRERLVASGIQSDTVQMTWCLQNVGGCVV